MEQIEDTTTSLTECIIRAADRPIQALGLRWYLTGKEFETCEEKRDGNDTR
jgi:hypothetical protein